MTLEKPSRRGFLAALGCGIIAAPAIVRAASIMPVKAIENFTLDNEGPCFFYESLKLHEFADRYPSAIENAAEFEIVRAPPPQISYKRWNEITREALEMFVNSNEFLENINKQFDEEFFNTGAKVGTTLRIKLPKDFTIRAETKLRLRSDV
jgi:hypothetical protein